MQKIIIFIFFLVAQNLAFSSNNLPDFTKLVEENKIPVTILTGYLGSGKTTFINYLLKEKPQNLEETEESHS